MAMRMPRKLKKGAFLRPAMTARAKPIIAMTGKMNCILFFSRLCYLVLQNRDRTGISDRDLASVALQVGGHRDDLTFGQRGRGCMHGRHDILEALYDILGRVHQGLEYLLFGRDPSLL